MWEESLHGDCFKRVKEVIASAPVLKFFDPSEEAVIQCDASQYGLGVCLMQNGQPVAYATRSLTSAESNYAQIEKELLAILFGVEKFESYAYVRRFKVETDHKPLESIVSLLSAPKRLQRMMLRLQNFDFEVEYKKGVLLHVELTCLVYKLCVQKRMFFSHWIQDLHWKRKWNALMHSAFCQLHPKARTESDWLQRQTVKWPDTKKKVPWQALEYFPYRDELVVKDGLILKAAWLSRDQSTENQSDHFFISKKFRRSLQDMRVKRGADVASDHHLVIANLKLKLKRNWTGAAPQQIRYYIGCLKDVQKLD